MKIPNQIEIQIINSNNENIEIEILFGLKIYIDENSYHNFSMIQTDSFGKKIINQNEIIENTELKNIENIKNFEPKKIELCLWDCSMVNSLQILHNNRNAKNCTVKFREDCIEDRWEDDSDKIYKFVVE